MIKLLYIHGLHSSPLPEKMAILKEKCELLVAPQIDYEGNPRVFLDLKDLVEEHQINYLVGSSAGGLMAFWLAKYQDCRALLFNPALNFFTQRPDLQKLVGDAPKGAGVFYDIILGEKDDTVDPIQTQKYLREREVPKSYAIHSYPELGHRIDLDTFRAACNLIS